MTRRDGPLDRHGGRGELEESVPAALPPPGGADAESNVSNLMELMALMYEVGLLLHLLVLPQLLSAFFPLSLEREEDRGSSATSHQNPP